MEDLLEKRKRLICELVEDEKYVPMKEKELAIFMQVKPEDRRELKTYFGGASGRGKNRADQARTVCARRKSSCVQLVCTSRVKTLALSCRTTKSCRIFLSRGKRKKDAYDGAKVVAEYIESREEGKSPEGEIIEVLGRRDEPGIDMLSVVRALGIPDEFPEKVLNQAQRVSKPVSETDCVMRRDLRAVRMVTIDGEDARDLDDAVSLEEKRRQMAAGCSYCGRCRLCAGKFRAGLGGKGTGNERLSAGSRDSHASQGAVQRVLFAKCRGRPTGAVVPDGSGQGRNYRQL